MTRSLLTIDLAALRRNVERLREAAGSAEVWAVVKADGYGHGALDCARAALAAGARGLCVATVGEGAALRDAFREPRILVMGPLAHGDVERALGAGLEVVAVDPVLPPGVPVHVKVDTGMGRFGMSPEEALALPGDRVVGIMSHLATADEDDEGFVREQLERFRTVADAFPGAVRHVANSAATLRFPDARFEAVRCGIAVYGLSPFPGRRPSDDGLEPVLSWRSHVAVEKTLSADESTGYGRRFVAERKTRIGLVPVGYGDGFRRGLTGTEVSVDGERRRVLGTVSMDSFAVELGDARAGAPVALIGDGILAEEHASRLGTINYEVVCGIRCGPERTKRRVVDG
ncbi:MAG: alanine racemase [Actinobacteria bacterium]|nr:MAG: alanine racemase [Actinomycetota bacterium]